LHGAFDLALGVEYLRNKEAGPDNSSLIGA